MKERPILFSGEMIRAILDDRKSMTRRVVKPQPPGHLDLAYRAGNGPAIGKWSFTNRNADPWRDPDDRPHMLACPYGQPGDLLVPLTTWAVGQWYDDHKPTELPADCAFWSWWDGDPDEIPPLGKRRPGRFMPTFLRHNLPRPLVTDVRVERLQEISEADCMREGFTPMCNHDTKEDVRMGFRLLWDSLDAKRGFGWDVNPFVWVISFERIEKP